MDQVEVCALEAVNLTKRFATIPAAENISFRLAGGQVLGCLGPNGSGKSTTVKMLMGLLKPSSGHVLFGGKDIHDDLAGYRRQVGYVPEEPNLYAYLSGREYLSLIGTLRGVERAVLERKIDDLLQLFLLHPHRHAPLGSYSKGMRQRVLLSAALLDNPAILILDEPLSGLDAVSALVVKNFLRRFAEAGRAVFYCSHVLEVVEKVCTEVMVLRQGRVLALTTVKELARASAQATLEQTFTQMVESADPDETSRDIMQVVTTP